MNKFKEVMKGALRGSFFGLVISYLGFFVIPACKSNIQEPTVDPKARPYVERFLERCKQYKLDCSTLSELTIEVGTIPDMNDLMRILGLKPSETSVIGVCFPFARRVILNKEYWKYQPRELLELLVFHELGHCVLDKEHTEETEIDIMNPYALSGRMYIRQYQQLNDKFFECYEDCPVVEFSYVGY